MTLMPLILGLAVAGQAALPLEKASQPPPLKVYSEVPTPTVPAATQTPGISPLRTPPTQTANPAVGPKPSVLQGRESSGTAGPAASSPLRAAVPRTLPAAPNESAAAQRKLAPLGVAAPTGPSAVASPVTPGNPLVARPRRTTPPEMIAQALQLPPDSEIEGRPTTLLEALEGSSDRRQRLDAAHAYWRLASAVAEFHFCLDESARIGRFEVRPQDAAAHRMAQAAATAALRKAQLGVVAAQHRLAEAARLSETGPLPLPADRPHIGPYQTRFDEMFSMQAAPASARLIDRTIPISRRAIDTRALAVHAAEDALEATVDAYGVGRADLATVVACRRQLGRQWRALVASVCRYNDDIADYAVSVAPARIGAPALVAMLITPTDNPAGAAGPNRSAATAAPLQPIPSYPSRVEPAGLTQPIPAASRGYSPLVPTNQPTLAPPRDSLPATGGPQPTLAPPRDRAVAAPSSGQPTLAPPRKLPEPPAGGAPATGKATAPPTGSGANAPSQGPITRTANRPDLDARGNSENLTTELYAALAEATPAVRARQLTAALHWDRAAPKENTLAMTLDECLRYYLGTDRRAVIDAYWMSSHQAAACEVLAQNVEMLKELVPLALDARSRSAGGESMLRLRAARLAADADRLDGEAALVESRFELTRQVGRPLDAPWLRTSTAPHCGPYLMKLEDQPPRLVRSWPLRRAATMIPVLNQSFQEHGTSVVEADRARAAATAEYRAARQPIDRALETIDHQTEQSLAFLATLTDYNQAIADYALAVLPPGLPPEKLIQTLVVQ